ncbi:hypothetical protein HYY73_00990 [Candidatus Woesearchaeota archaeon]|nr:hypothetical protein [Candidatus Woesearchaeota archaeon]
MKKGVVLVLLMAFALVIAGCKGGDKGVTSSSSTPFIGGAEGLTAKFAENSPPPEVTDAQKNPAGAITPTFPFDIVVLLENVGEYDVLKAGATVTISGLSASDFLKSRKNTDNAAVSLIGVSPAEDLNGVKKDPDGNKIPGGTTDVWFKQLAYQKELQGNNPFPVQADICYTYQTKAQADMCIRKDLTKSVSGVCQIAAQKQVFNSGAPVHVTTVKESIAGKNKVLLTFNVKSVGTGNVFKFDSVTGKTACERGDFKTTDQVLVAVKTGLGSLTCNGLSDGRPLDVVNGEYAGYLRLSNGEGTFSCIQPTPEEDSVKKIDVKLTYNYLISKSTSILVKHLLS